MSAGAISVDAVIREGKLFWRLSSGGMEFLIDAVSSDPSGCGCMWEDGRRIVSCGKAGHQ